MKPWTIGRSHTASNNTGHGRNTANAGYHQPTRKNGRTGRPRGRVWECPCGRRHRIPSISVRENEEYTFICPVCGLAQPPEAK